MEVFKIVLSRWSNILKLNGRSSESVALSLSDQVPRFENSLPAVKIHIAIEMRQQSVTQTLPRMAL